MPAADIGSILTVPEIQNKLALHLAYRDLESCQSVCSAWRLVFTPLVWQERPLTLLGDIDNHNDPESLQLLQLYGRYVRNLTIQRVYTLHTIAQYLNYISTLTVRQQLVTDGGEHARWPQLVAFIASCSNLHTLVIHTRFDSRLSQFVPALSRAVGNRLRRLTIHMGRLQSGRSTDLINILTGLPNLISLRVFSGRQDWELDHDRTLLDSHAMKLRLLEVYVQGRLVTHLDLLAPKSGTSKMTFYFPVPT
ncbi:hypothetical protein DFQ27_006446 [Actinomortierella ambigua]|uniref:F-box domain-containing protein n=1 Tax=Actinomortierella ambigua TaxID=1343610 RepID=A0A9P6QLS0_9FUNG|nr:hypothetical protein DFQ27_006446 [Actinomortierella ambigua]